MDIDLLGIKAGTRSLTGYPVIYYCEDVTLIKWTRKQVKQIR